MDKENIKQEKESNTLKFNLFSQKEKEDALKKQGETFTFLYWQ